MTTGPLASAESTGDRCAFREPLESAFLLSWFIGTVLRYSVAMLTTLTPRLDIVSIHRQYCAHRCAVSMTWGIRARTESSSRRRMKALADSESSSKWSFSKTCECVEISLYKNK